MIFDIAQENGETIESYEFNVSYPSEGGFELNFVEKKTVSSSTQERMNISTRGRRLGIYIYYNFSLEQNKTKQNNAYLSSSSPSSPA